MKRITNFFKLKQYQTNIKVEIFGGIATFLAMAYILVVNPNNILLNGTADVRWSSVFVATAIGAFIGTLLMAIIANKPFGVASTMGVNAMIGSVLGGTLGFAFSYGNGMLIIFLSGLIFLLLSIIPINKDENGKYVTLREKLFDGTPKAIIDAVAVGIGLFITMIGLKNAGLITASEFTLVRLMDFGSSANWAYGGDAYRAIVALFGLIVITVLSHYKVKSAVVIGIVSATLLAIPTGVADINILLGKTDGISWGFIDNLKNYFSFDPDSGGIFLSLFTEGINFPKGSLFTVISLILTFIMLDLFDTIGTIVGCATNAHLVDDKGKPDDYNKIMYADSLASCTGAIVGTTTVSTFVESGAGIATGAKTGLAALVTAILFLSSIFLLPVFAFIPIEAASSALLYVGVLMIRNIKKIDFNNLKNAIPSFLTIILMPLTYSITDGIGIGIISYFVITFVIYIIDRIRYKSGDKPKLELSLVTLIIVILFLAYFLVPKVV